MPDHSEIQLFQLRRGWDKDSFAFSELVFDWNGEMIRTICLEIGEIRLLVCADESIDTLCDKLPSNVLWNFEIETIDEKGNIKNFSQELDFESVFAYFMESDLERYECWRCDLGSEGIGSARESQYAVPLLLTYDYIRWDTTAEEIHKWLDKALKSDDIEDFFEDFESKRLYW